METKNNTKYYKILNEQMNHNGFQYKMGLNIDTKEFNPTGSCEGGGLYYTTEELLHMFLYYGCLVAEVEVPPDAQVYRDPYCDVYKADRIIITKITSFHDSEMIKKIITKKLASDSLILCIVEQTPELCMEAVKQDSFALQYVKEQTPELCLEAVRKHGKTLQFVKEQTPELCMEAVKQNGYALQFVKEQTPELCLEAVKQDGYALKYVKNRTPELCMEAVKKSGLGAYQYVLYEFRTWSLLFKAILRT